MSEHPQADGLWSHGGPSGAVFWVGVAIGWAGILFGVWSLLRRPGATDPWNSGSLFTLLLLGHDLVVVPIVAAIGVVMVRRLPPGARGAITGAMVATGVVALFSIPLLGGFGRIAANPSLLPRNYVSGVAIVIGAVWGISGIVALRAHIRIRRSTR